MKHITSERFRHAKSKAANVCSHKYNQYNRPDRHPNGYCTLPDMPTQSAQTMNELG